MVVKQKKVTMFKSTGLCAVLCVVAAFFSEGVSFGQEAEKDAAEVKEVHATELDQKESLLRQESYERAKGYFDNANSSFELNGDFEFAEQNYEKAIAELEKAKGASTEAGFSKKVLKLQDEIERRKMVMNIRWANRLIDEAIRNANEDKTDEAEEKLNRAASYPKISTTDKDRIVKLKRQMEMKRAEIRFAGETKVSEIIQDKAEDDLQVRIKLEKGRVLLQNSRFGDARDMFEQVLLSDPTNLSAIRYLARVNKAQEKAADEKLKTTLLERMAEVRWKWSEPVTPLLAGAGAEASVKAIAKGGMAINLEGKLESIVFPDVKFNAEPLPDVLRKLRNQSVQYDPDNEGVNMIWNLKPLGSAIAQANAVAENAQSENDFTGDFGNDGGGAGGGGAGGGDDFAEDLGGSTAKTPEPVITDSLEESTVTMEMTNAKLSDILKYVCLVTGAKMKIDGTAVVINHPSNPMNELETRFYDVEAGVFDAKKTQNKPKGLKL